MDKNTFIRFRYQNNNNKVINENTKVIENRKKIIKIISKVNTKIIIDIPSGEEFQQLANYYIGEEDDFVYNPLIKQQESRFKYIHKINEEWDNPFVLFCYGGRIIEFAKKLKFLKNECIIIFGNSDENQTLEKCQSYIDWPKVLHIFCQNLSCYNDKASLIPIGMANKQWPHGNINNFLELDIGVLHKEKTKDLFCSFKVDTNFIKRSECLIAINKKGISNIFYSDPKDYLKELSLHKYCICPEGNGLDSHRFWEALWVESIPITLRNTLTEQIQKLGVPCILLNNWDELDISKLTDYSSFVFNEDYFKRISFKFYSDKILSYVPEPVEKMNVVLSFIGKMPSYIIECVTQLRLFFKDSIYVIYNDISDEIKNKLNEYNVIFVEYNTVISGRFNNFQKNKNFDIVNGLVGREELFRRSYERFYLLEELMKRYQLKNIWFMELDVVMYTNPNIFLKTLQYYPYCYCAHDEVRSNGSIFYVKDVESFQPILNTFDLHIPNGLISEMYSLNQHLKKNQNILLFPLTFSNLNTIEFWGSNGLFNGYIFDGAIMGQYLFGVDPYHTNRKIIIKNMESINYQYHYKDNIEIWNYIIEWKKNDNNLFLPYIREHPRGKLIPISNLHIHSKDLISAVSYTSNKNIHSNLLPKYVLSKYLKKCNINKVTPGLGDYLRGSLVLLSLSLKYDYIFKVDYNCNPFFEYIEKNDIYQAHEELVNLDTIELISPLKSDIIQTKLLNLFNTEENLSIITSSIFLNDVTLDDITLFKDIFKPSIIIKNKINEFIEKYINKNKKIYLFHIRLGDSFLNDTEKIDTSLFNDYTNSIIKKIEEIKEMNIILISDCINFKKHIKLTIPNIIVTDSNPIHMGDLKNYNSIDVENTVFEFFLMSYVNHIYSYNIYGSSSGFSNLISFLYNIPLTYIPLT